MHLPMPVTDSQELLHRIPQKHVCSMVPALFIRMCRGSLRAKKSFTKPRMLSNWATSRCRGVTLLVPRCSLIASAALQSHTESIRSRTHFIQPYEAVLACH